MDEVRARNKIEVETHQEKVDFINDAYQKKLRYWKRVALESVSTENKAKELILIRKVKNEKMVNIDEIIFYLKSQYLAHNNEQRNFIRLPRKENTPSFEAITDSQKTFSNL